MITINIQTEGSIPCIKPEGRLDTINSSQFSMAIQPLAESELYLVIDLSLCNYLSSTGIRILLATYKKLKAKNGILFISGIAPEVFQVLEMAGLHQFFQYSDNLQTAVSEINILKNGKTKTETWDTGNFQFHFSPTDSKITPSYTWNKQGIVGYNELEIALGTGYTAEFQEENVNTEGLFVTTGNCAGFIPRDKMLPSEFRTPKIPSQAGIVVNQAISFSSNTDGLVLLSKPNSISVLQLADSIYQMRSQVKNGQSVIWGYIIADYNKYAPSVSICLVFDDPALVNLKQLELGDLTSSFSKTEKGLYLLGAKFGLDEIRKPTGNNSLQNFLDEVLTIENINNVKELDLAAVLIEPATWIVSAETIEDASVKRISIVSQDNDTIEDYKIFLARRLYRDSSKVELIKLHGGYSAQTFHVESFDTEGRKLRPTVLKFANRAMITREAERCKQYSLPYILNNSAMVLGTEFFGDHGALCYNFVGIGGEQTQLKWLTHYFQNWSAEKLEPLFDKTFMQILKPWYGQPINDTIFPFRDHDPTVTFFPHIYDIAAQLFSISADEEFFTVNETGQKLTNPYWFLKHEYKKRRGFSMDYVSSICHGDLNMQNILLDQDMNVYLIDFSETRPRSVVSDFARLEAIFMIEYAPLENETDFVNMLKFANNFYNTDRLDSIPKNTYDAGYSEIMQKNYALTVKMREYAFKSSLANTGIVPYYLALLEWILPVICYFQLPFVKKRYAMVVSALICEKVREILK